MKKFDIPTAEEWINRPLDKMDKKKHLGFEGYLGYFSQAGDYLLWISSTKHTLEEPIVYHSIDVFYKPQKFSGFTQNGNFSHTIEIPVFPQHSLGEHVFCSQICIYTDKPLAKESFCKWYADEMKRANSQVKDFIAQRRMCGAEPEFSL